MNPSTRHPTDIKSALQNPFGVALCVYYFFMVLVGVFVPDDILKDHMWAAEFCNFMASIIPQIDIVTSIGVNSDVNRFYFSVLWLGSPVLVGIVLLGALVDGINENMVDASMSEAKLIASAVVAAGSCFYILSMSYVDDTSRLTQGLLGFNLGRSFGAQLVFVNGPIMFLAASLVLLPYFILTGKYKSALS